MAVRSKRNPLPKELVRAQQFLDHNYVGMAEFADMLNVSRQWINMLFKQERIVGAITFLGKHYIPHDPRILRGDDRMRGGRIEEYIEDWEFRHRDDLEMEATWVDPYTKEIRGNERF